MKHICKKLTVIVLLAVIVLLSGCSFDSKEYFAEITVPIEDASAEIVIKEWRYLLGSGAEIYYKKDSKLTLLGITTGGDDGYCPFKDGKYTLNVEDSELIVRWSFQGNDSQDTWKEKHFTLPDT